MIEFTLQTMHNEKGMTHKNQFDLQSVCQEEFNAVNTMGRGVQRWQ